MPGKMKSVCEGCGGEILFEKDSTGDEIIEADSEQHVTLCGTCAAKPSDSKGERITGDRGDADFEDEHNKAMRTGGASDQAASPKAGK
jgi:hypothetical protein